MSDHVDRALTPEEALWVTASATRHRAARARDGASQLFGMLGASVPAALVSLLTTWWLGLGVFLIGVLIMLGESRQHAARMARARTIWDPPEHGWCVREWKLRVNRVDAVTGPPEDYDTFAVFSLKGGRKFACSLWALTLRADTIPEEVAQVAFSQVHLRKLEPGGPFLPVWFEGAAVPSAQREDVEWSPRKPVGFTRGPPNAT